MSNIKTRDRKMLISFIVSIVVILVLAISILFLPYITAVTLGDLENVTFISVRNVEKSIYSEEGAKTLDIIMVHNRWFFLRNFPCLFYKFVL